MAPAAAPGVRDQHGHARRAVGGERAAGVEAEPADPQHAGPGRGFMVRLCGGMGGLGKALALAEHQRRHQRRDPGIDMHHGAAGKSITPSFCSQPSPHTQWHTGTYTC